MLHHRGIFKAGNQNRLTLFDGNIEGFENDEESLDRVGDNEAEALFGLEEDQTEGLVPEINNHEESLNNQQIDVPVGHYNLRSGARTTNINLTELQEDGPNPVVGGDTASHDSESVQGGGMAKVL